MIPSSTSSRSLASSPASAARSRPRQDRRHRRAQVVRDRAQHRRLHLVAAPQRRRLDHLRLQPLARSAAARIDSSAGTIRSRSRSSCVGRQLRRHDERADLPVVPSCSGIAVRARRPRPTPSSIDAERRADRLREPPRGERQRVAPAAAAEQQPRQLGREVGLAAALDSPPTRARARPRPASSRPARPSRNASSATQLRSSAIVKRPTGGRWKKLNAAALANAVNTPSPAPSRSRRPGPAAGRRRRARRPARSA